MSTFLQGPVGIGIAVAAAIGAVLAVLGLTFESDPSSPWAYVLPLSLPVGVVLAWRHAGAVANSPRYPVGRVIVMALQALVLGALLVGTSATVVATVTGVQRFATVLEAIGQAVGVAALGIVFFGIPMLALILPLVALWAALVRSLTRPGRLDSQGSDPRPGVALWAAVLAASLLVANVLWPLFGVLGASAVGWFAALIAWVVVAPVALVMLVVNLIGALRSRGVPGS